MTRLCGRSGSQKLFSLSLCRDTMCSHCQFSLRPSLASFDSLFSSSYFFLPLDCLRFAAQKCTVPKAWNKLSICHTCMSYQRKEMCLCCGGGSIIITKCPATMTTIHVTYETTTRRRRRRRLLREIILQSSCKYAVIYSLVAPTHSDQNWTLAILANATDCNDSQSGPCVCEYVWHEMTWNTANSLWW